MAFDIQISASDQMLRRICAEYLEMPGLRLTLPQAQRLWGLDQATCASSLEFLVAAKFLTKTNQQTYVRLTEGASDPFPLRMAKAALDERKAQVRRHAVAG